MLGIIKMRVEAIKKLLKRSRLPWANYPAVIWQQGTPKRQAPNTKLQRSSKSQAPNQGPRDVVAIQGRALRFGAWNFPGAWSLRFEASQPSHSTENSEEPLMECDRPRSQQVPPGQSMLEILCAGGKGRGEGERRIQFSSGFQMEEGRSPDVPLKPPRTVK